MLFTSQIGNIMAISNGKVYLGVITLDVLNLLQYCSLEDSDFTYPTGSAHASRPPASA